VAAAGTEPEDPGPETGTPAGPGIFCRGIYFSGFKGNQLSEPAGIPQTGGSAEKTGTGARPCESQAQGGCPDGPQKVHKSHQGLRGNSAEG